MNFHTINTATSNVPAEELDAENLADTFQWVNAGRHNGIPRGSKFIDMFTRFHFVHEQDGPNHNSIHNARRQYAVR